MFLKDPTKILHNAMKKNSLYTNSKIADDVREEILSAIKDGADLSQYIEGEDFGNTPLLWAAGYGDKELIEIILERAPQTTNLFNTMTDFGQNTPLTLAIKRCEFDAVLHLLEAGANPNLPCTDSEGGSTITPLQLAVLCLGSVAEDKNQIIIDIIKKMLEKGADMDMKNDIGYSARYYLTEFRINMEDLYTVGVTNIKKRNETYSPEQLENLKEEFFNQYVSSMTDEEKEKIYVENVYEGSGLEKMDKEKVLNMLLRDQAKDSFNEEYEAKLKSLESHEENITVQQLLSNQTGYASFKDFMVEQKGFLTTSEYQYYVHRKERDEGENVALIEFTFQDHPVHVFNFDNSRNKYLETEAGKQVISEIISLSHQPTQRSDL